MKPMAIGEYLLGSRNVKLIAIAGTSGGSFRVTPMHGTAEILVCLGYARWMQVFQILLHETFELAMVDCNCRFAPSPDYVESHDRYLFSMTHPQFSDIAARAAEFIGACAHDLSLAYKKQRRILCSKGKR